MIFCVKFVANSSPRSHWFFFSNSVNGSNDALTIVFTKTDPDAYARSNVDKKPPK